MDDRELGREALVLQIGIEGLELQRRDHALVAERPAGERDEVGAELVLRALAEPVRATVECDAGQGRLVTDRGTGEEHLLEGGARLVRQLAEMLGLDRDLAPAEHHDVLARRDPLDALLLRLALLVIARQEDHAGRVLPHRRQLEADDGAQELVRHLRQDAGAVARARVGSDRAAVLEVAQRGEREVDDVVSRLAAERRDHREAARVLLERGVVHALLLGQGAGIDVARARCHG